MKIWIAQLLCIISCGVCYAGAGCSTMCTHEEQITVVTNLTVTPRKPPLLSEQRKTHPANASKSKLNLAALKLARKASALDINQPGLTDTEKEEKARLLREDVERKMKVIEDEKQQERRRWRAEEMADQKVLEAAKKELQKKLRKQDSKDTLHRKRARRIGLKGYPAIKHLRRHATQIILEAPIEAKPEPDLQVEEA